MAEPLVGLQFIDNLLDAAQGSGADVVFHSFHIMVGGFRFNAEEVEKLRQNRMAFDDSAGETFAFLRQGQACLLYTSRCV